MIKDQLDHKKDYGILKLVLYLLYFVLDYVKIILSQVHLKDNFLYGKVIELLHK